MATARTPLLAWPNYPVSFLWVVFLAFVAFIAFGVFVLFSGLTAQAAVGGNPVDRPTIAAAACAIVSLFFAFLAALFVAAVS